MSDAQSVVTFCAAYEGVGNHSRDAEQTANHVPHREESRRRLVLGDEESADEHTNAREDDRHCAGVEARSRRRLVINRLDQLWRVDEVGEKAAMRVLVDLRWTQ